MERTFVVNKTLGYLTISKTRMTVDPRTGGRLVVSVRLAHDAQLTFTVRDVYGRAVRLLSSGALTPGTYAVVWDGRNDAGRVVKPGTYIVRAAARNEIGRVVLQRRFALVAKS
jgi:flagellar hook assembly protein FlgD